MNNNKNEKLEKYVILKEAKKRQIYYSPPSGECGLCSKSLLQEKYYIDGATKNDGPWANMCGECFYEHGVGIAWGKGQLYMQIKKGKWLQVAGFSPRNIENNAVCTLCGEQFSKNDLIKLKNNEWACQNCIEEGASIMRQSFEKKKITDQSRINPTNNENKNLPNKKVSREMRLKRLQELARRRHRATLMRKLLE